MLLVIFGAGASFDADPTNRLNLPTNRLDVAGGRLPLACDLFADREVFHKALKTYWRCQPIVPFLRTTNDVESRLERLSAEAPKNRERLEQLLSIRYYLRDALWSCEQRFWEITHGVTTYKALLDQIKQVNPNGPVCLATFNYDTLLDEALYLNPVSWSTGLDAYIRSGLFYYVKLHGSLNWLRLVDGPQGMSSPSDYNWYCSNFEKVSVSDNFSWFPRAWDPAGTSPQAPGWPAVAVPLRSKTSFECPQTHLDKLWDLLPQVGRILIVGWRGRDEHFVRELHARLRPKLPIQLVVGTPNAEAETIQALESGGIDARWRKTGLGFSDYVTGEHGLTFLSGR